MEYIIVAFLQVDSSVCSPEYGDLGQCETAGPG